MQMRPEKKKKDTFVIYGAERKARAWVAGKAISVQPDFQRNILRGKHTWILVVKSICKIDKNWFDHTEVTRT